MSRSGGLQTNEQSQITKIRPLEENVYTSRFSIGKLFVCNNHVYHFHVSESLNFDLFIVGEGGKGDIV